MCFSKRTSRPVTPNACSMLAESASRGVWSISPTESAEMDVEVEEARDMEVQRLQRIISGRAEHIQQ